MASLDNGKYGLAFSSGLGVTTAIITLCESGDEIVAGDDIYGGTNRLFRNVAVKMGITVKFVDPTDLAAVENAITSKTKVSSYEQKMMCISSIETFALLSACLDGNTN
jgi:cystathionine gamma-lyase